MKRSKDHSESEGSAVEDEFVEHSEDEIESIGESTGESIVDEYEKVALTVCDAFKEDHYQHMLRDGYFSAPKLPVSWIEGERVEYSSTLKKNSNWKQKIDEAFNKKFPSLAVDAKVIMEGISQRRDVFHCEENHETHRDLIYILAASILDRICRVRDQIIKNNQRKALDKLDEIRDQGFTRPRVLVLVPFRNGAHRLVNAMMDLWSASETGSQVEQRKRFESEYGPDEEEEELDESRPADYRHCFEGNIDDCFRIGLKVTRKALKLYSDFYSADIIIASPLGLKLVIDGQDVQKKPKKDIKADDRKRRKPQEDSDFLSSIDTFIVDQADVIAMQNWEHLGEIFERINKVPRESHGCDFSRVLSVFLDGQARKARQTIMLSDGAFPELLAIANKCANVNGWLRILSPSKRVALKNVAPSFHLLPETGPSEEADARFHYFTQTLLPATAASPQNHILVHCATYFEFVRLREYIEKSEYSPSFTFISEYDDTKDVTRARSRFFNGHVRFLLVTERFMFFHRFHIKGVKRLIFYSLPVHAQHVVEWCGIVQVRDGVKVAPCVVASSLDLLKVSSLVGRDKAKTVLGIDD